MPASKEELGSLGSSLEEVLKPYFAFELYFCGKVTFLHSHGLAPLGGDRRSSFRTGLNAFAVHAYVTTSCCLHWLYTSMHAWYAAAPILFDEAHRAGRSKSQYLVLQVTQSAEVLLFACMLLREAWFLDTQRRLARTWQAILAASSDGGLLLDGGDLDGIRRDLARFQRRLFCCLASATCALSAWTVGWMAWSQQAAPVRQIMEILVFIRICFPPFIFSLVHSKLVEAVLRRLNARIRYHLLTEPVHGSRGPFERRISEADGSQLAVNGTVMIIVTCVSCLLL